MENTTMEALETAQAAPKAKKHSSLPAFLAVLLIVSILANVAAVGFLTWRTNRAFGKLDGLETQLRALAEQKEQILDNGDIAAEDDVVIADEYMIRSTTQISDAYLSGDTSQLSDRDKQTLDLAKSVLASTVTDGMSDYEKEKAVYLWLTTKLHNNTGLLTVIPTTDGGEDNPYGVLRNHSAVCVGYATTFRLLMQMQGIECKVIHSSDRIHSWDLVRLDGDWYHVDCYMDADSGSMANFNMNDTLAANSHEWNTEFFPAAQGIRYSPAMMNLSTVKDIYEIPAFVKNMVTEREGVAGLRFEQKIDRNTETAAAALVDRLRDTLWNSEYSFNTVDFNWTLDENGDYVLCIFVPQETEQYEGEIDEETEQKINDAIEEAFGNVSYDEPVYDWEGAVG